MVKKLLSSNTLHAVIIVLVMIAASFVLLVQTNVVAAQTADTQLTVGLQNPAKSLNFFDVATNSVWKAYMLEYNFEPLYTYDPDSVIYADLASDVTPTAAQCPTGQLPGPYTGMCHDTEFLNFTVFLHPGTKFTDGQPMTANDVVFSYQTLGWSTNAQVIYPALWWPQPIAPLWNATANGGSCSAPGGLPYACMSHTAVWKVTDTEVRFQLIPVVQGGVKGAYALFFYATMVVPIIPQHIWKDHLMGSALNNWTIGATGNVVDTWDRSINTAWTPYGCADQGLPAGCPVPYPETVGTGPFYLDSYTANSQTTIKVYTGYWGNGLSHTWNNVAYPFYPTFLRSVKFVIFLSLDVVSLALQQGSIDTLVWSLTPGFYTQVKANPAITVETVTDSGFFYMSFNMRRQPWDDLCLRQAVSKAIDKSYIVNTLMGGFGIAGTVPISVVNPGYVNASASPPAFDKSGIVPLLQSCGYTQDASTGFIKAPAREGGQIVAATILTPPKDYDPVRADAGTMISKNLKDVGVNIGSAPTSFDTIVSRGLTYGQVDYDIYVLGWSLGIFPETYICSFFCSGQDVMTNIAGSNSAGYKNQTVDNLINSLTYTVDTATRVKQMQDVEGIVTNAIPWNVLYYRKNLNAFRNDKFGGWIDNPVLNALSAGGGPYNYYSLVNLKPTSYTVPPTGGALTVTATIPQHVLANVAVPISAYVSQNGIPVNGATVTLTATLASGTVLNTGSGTTGVTGTALIAWTTPFLQGDIFVTLAAASGSSTGSTTKQLTVTIGPPAPIAQLSLSTATPVISPTGTADVTATLVDGQGHPITGATVNIDTTLVLGSMNRSSAPTNGNGIALFKYSPPPIALFNNAHQIDTLRANVTVPNTIVGDTQTASLSIIVQNDVAPAWVQVKVQGTPSLVLGPVTGTSTNITVKATGWSGAAVAGIPVAGVLEAGEHNVTVTPATATTDASGLATFRIDSAIATTAVSQNALVRFTPVGQVAYTSDQVALLLSNNVATGYAARITFNSNTLPFSAAGSTAIVTANVVDQAGLPVSNVPVEFQVGYGDLGIPVEFNWTFDYTNWVYGGDGLALNALGGGTVGGAFQNSGATNDIYGVENLLLDAEVLGPGPNGLDSCAPYAGWDGSYIVNATSVTGATGQFSASFRALPLPKDNAAQVILYVGAPGQTLATLVNTCSPLTSFSGAAFKIDSGVVVQRAPVFAMGSAVTTSTEPGSTAPQTVFTSLSRSMNITATFYKLGGVPAAGVQIFALRGSGSAARNIHGTYGGTVTTDANGQYEYKNTVAYLSGAQSYGFGWVAADPAFSFGGREQLYGDPGALGDYWFGPTFTVLIAKFPFEMTRGYMFIPYTQAFAVAAPLQSFLPLGGTTQVLVGVFNANATPTSGIAGASVWSGAVQTTSNETGWAMFNYTAPVGASGALEGLVVVTTSSGQAIRAWFGVMASGPVLTYGQITPTVGQVGQTSSFAITVTNTVPVSGTATVVMVVDNKTVASQDVSIGALQPVSVTFTYVFTSAGAHTVGIGTASTTANVVAPPSTLDLGTAYILAGALLVVGIVVGVVVGMLMSRRRKKPSAAMPEEEPSTEAKPTEEELPPEDKL